MTKLAEALILRADAQKRLAQLRGRLMRVATVQDGETPVEDPRTLLREIEQTSTTLLDLIQRINRTNSQTAFDEVGTLADGLAQRDILSQRAAVYRQLAESATAVNHRYSLSEIKTKPTVDVQNVQRQADELAIEYRELDAKIQAANWATDVVE